MGKRTDKVYVGAHFGDWEVKEYLGKSKWLCECICGTKREILTGKLTTGLTRSCGHRKLIDLTGQKFGDWEVKRYAGNMLWECQCSCENKTIKLINGRHLREGVSRNCGHNGSTKRIDLTGNVVGEYKVIKYAGDKYWLCQCSCGKYNLIHGAKLRNNEVKSCGHAKRIHNLEGMRFGKLVARKYVYRGRYECDCDCGNTTSVLTGYLLNNSVRSCGCLRESKFTREYILDQISEFEIEHGVKPFKAEIVQYMGISYEYLLYLCRTLDIPNSYFNINFGSYEEKEVYDLIKSIDPDINIVLHSFNIIKNREIDIYLPNKKIAIEFNGDYWHQASFKDKMYHQNKTIECAKRGIRLIHIFEYEWINEDYRPKIVNLIKDAISNDANIVYARKCELVELDKDEEIELLDSTHLQGYSYANIAYGLKYNDQIISVMSFGTPRFNKDYQWEMIRYANLPGYRVVGGAEKLFKAFVKNYNPDSIVSYCDISKFTGNVYTRLGFKSDIKSITEPGYCWVRHYRNSESKGERADRLSRYQTQKHKLINQGLGEYGDTEDEIMTNLGYIKVHDCGNLRLVWTK